MQSGNLKIFDVRLLMRFSSKSKPTKDIVKGFFHVYIFSYFSVEYFETESRCFLTNKGLSSAMKLLLSGDCLNRVSILTTRFCTGMLFFFVQHILFPHLARFTFSRVIDFDFDLCFFKLKCSKRYFTAEANHSQLI